MDRKCNKYAIIKIRSCPDRTLLDKKCKCMRLSEADIYIFAYNITEMELISEIEALKDFYDEIVMGCATPPHIREEAIILASCRQGAQCNMFCEYYEGGCMKYATK